MLSARMAFTLVACSSFAVLAVACASAPPSNKTMVVECDENQAEPCSDDSPTNTRRGSTSSSSGTGPDMPPEEVAPPAENRDAGRVDASGSSSSGGTGTRGPSCTALAACCEKVEQAGFTGSARQCRSVVSTNNEYACSLTKAEYAKPVEDYDAICP